jgi:hypothetical protein
MGNPATNRRLSPEKICALVVIVAAILLIYFPFWTAFQPLSGTSQAASQMKRTKTKDSKSAILRLKLSELQPVFSAHPLRVSSVR